MESWPEYVGKSVMKEFIAGGFGGMAGVLAGHPLDTLKIRLQQPSSPSMKPPSPFTLLRNILSTQGPSALYRGMAAPFATVAIQNAVSFQTYVLVSQYLSGMQGDEEGRGRGKASLKTIALAGLAAGAIPTVILTPVELVKIRLQLAANNSHNALSKVGPLELAQDIMVKQGVRGLYKGFTITALREGPAVALYFSTYEYTREFIHTHSEKKGQGEPSLLTMLHAGGIAGVASWMFCYPLDVVKSRLQAQGAGRPKYGGIIDCFRKSVRDEGFPVLWRGLGTTLTRAYIVNGAIFSAYELALRFMTPPQHHLKLEGSM